MVSCGWFRRRSRRLGNRSRRSGRRSVRTADSLCSARTSRDAMPESPLKKSVQLTVNGAAVSAEVEPRLQLAELLREHLLLTGTHLGCEHGVCGACTVNVDGAPVRSCITFAVACDGADVRTIE